MSDPSSTKNDKGYVCVDLLTRLGQVTGHQFDIERIDQLLEVVYGRAHGDPFAQLALAVEELTLKAATAFEPLAQAVWHANADNPIVFWSEPEQRYFIVTGVTAFKVRIATFEEDAYGSETISRAKLGRLLGLKSVNEPLEYAIIESQTPTEGASAATEKREGEQFLRHSASTHGHDEHGHHSHLPPLKRFLRILKPERKDIITLLIFSVFSGVLYLSLPLAVDTIVTNLAFGAQSDPYIQALIVVAKILAACLILQALVLAFQYYVAEVIQRRIFVRTASELAFRLPRVRAESLDGIHGPELVNRFLDVVTVQKNTTYFLLEGVNLVAASLIGMILLAFYHPLLLLLVTILVVLIILVTWILGRGAVDTAIEESIPKYDLVAWFQEIAAYPFMFKGSGGYDMAYHRTNLLATKFVNARKKHFGKVFRQISGLLILSIIASVAVLILGTWLVLSQQITLGQLVASELIMSSIVYSLLKLGKKLEAWYDTMASTDKLGHIFDLETESTVGECPVIDYTRGISIKARDLAFGYKRGKLLFQELNFEIAPGEKVAIYGPQGSGVSSILNLFFAVRQPNDGSISFDGLDGRSWDLETLRESVQLLRRDEFIEGSIVENLRLGRTEISMDEIRDALEKVGILDRVLSRPEGFDLQIQVGGSPLSYTQRISLLFARALVQRPRLLLIDELFDGLDTPIYEHLTKVIFESDLNCTIVVATRTKDLLSKCDRTLSLSTPSRP
ncbi:ATP-binding cassette domain-containing protein [bacterium]|nr:ATP-binding cassette domain-containing protein [bacterium]MDA7933854.1 ATP-binding cassette domain-containing protein [Akkermansiaceae bacterium]MDB4465014.1 ATP-binding cassette domain-containing protein [Akkermansiaceae bacterium]MDB4466384.1 ATP-binding cassette domain-containing protein [bacterium]